ncbi:Spx/MgsR family RNA polymerase-binding regulatory protein [Peptoniphilus sp. MSJ-1]|uniref:Spx/MgsR family RNA polymerase-binding regulatory protein n=1 Tax=Peptoniphilus ovalis TaxID=2841503 RepID=A0ABS6FDN7_9FIRM|nr:Spx/MgsR family RNA polymerase-binding regulatory protein [Peptoniphilus ovalis]MBU5668290.1 Spx/MgsR family RNA polymerase-binding regulatory protein [Peptoniphilus ovalis]
MTKLIGYKKCSTCKNIEKMLDEKNISYEYREIDKDLLSVDELKEIREKADVDIFKLFNTSGMRYRELGLKDKKNEMTEEEIYELLSTDGMLVKRPILLKDNKAYVGPQVKKYLETL